MARKKGGGHGGGHGWYVTFADLMGLLMMFFVTLTAFSTMDKQKLQTVAGSMREAFGTQTQFRYSGMVEVDGLPTRQKLKHVGQIDPKDATDNPAPTDPETEKDNNLRSRDLEFALAAASLRQALQDLPEITEVSKNIVMEETKQGLDISLIDQDGRAMFPEGMKEPVERARRVLLQLAGPLKQMPYRITITGHTAATRAPPRPGYGPWDLSADRANAVRQILEEAGVPSSQVFSVAGKADTEPMFPDDPYLSANRRVTLTLMKEAPPLPTGFTP
ncbi:MAG: flagellar motor protein MotB [Methylacidiphilales bacterium]|nr:flagellar motor protein MotB [Candidatus Methylacidiphilales bacterium]